MAFVKDLSNYKKYGFRSRFAMEYTTSIYDARLEEIINLEDLKKNLQKQYNHIKEDISNLKNLPKEEIKQSIIDKINNFQQNLRSIQNELVEVEGQLINIQQGNSRDDFYTPSFVVEAVNILLNGKKFENAFDPWAGHGTFLTSIVKNNQANKGIGICFTKEEYTYAALLGKDLNIKWEIANPIQWIASCDDDFDLIVSQPPIGMKISREARQSLRYQGIVGRLEELIILEACRHLKPDGIGIFYVPEYFVSTLNPKSVKQNLHKFDLCLDTFLSTPNVRSMLAKTDYRSQIPKGIVIIRKSDPMPVFTGKISRDEGQLEELLKNQKQRKAAKDSALGAVVQSNEFEGYERLRIQERIVLLGKKFGYQTVPLTNITKEVNRVIPNQNETFTEKENSIYLPNIGTSDVVTQLLDLILKPDRYLQLVIEPSLARADYIAGLFNSPIGHLLREQGREGYVIQHLTKSSINGITVFLPPLHQQEEIIRSDQAVKLINADLESIKYQLWSEPRNIKSIKQKLDKLTREESFKEWLDHLPFPLASILWAYHAAGEDYKTRYEHLLHFFEASSAFLATILLSSIREDTEFKEAIFPNLKIQLNQHNINFERASFGTWQTTFSNCAKFLRESRSQGTDSRERIYRLLKTHDPDIVDMLLSKKLATLFQDVNTLRNRWKGHGGIVGPEIARERYDQLNKYLLQIREIFGSSWNRYHLIQPVSSKYSKGIHHVTVQLVKGTSTPFEKTTLKLESPLEHEYLHLLGDGESRALQLLPFVILSSSPESAHNACYFYSKTEGETVRYISYHFETRPEIVNSYSTMPNGFDELLNQK